jgi:outer membrane murein-binding lipoprotein Lpp
MSFFGFVSKEKYRQLEKENRELKKTQEMLRKEIENITAQRDAAVEKASKASLRCKEDESSLLPLRTENSELKSRIETLENERKLFQKHIQNLASKAKQQKRPKPQLKG